MLHGNDYTVNQLLMGKVALDELTAKYDDLKHVLVEKIVEKIDDGSAMAALDGCIDELVLLKMQIDESASDLVEMIDDLIEVEDQLTADDSEDHESHVQWDPNENSRN